MRYLIFLMITFEVKLLFADNRTDLVQVARDIEEFMTLETTNLKLLSESSIALKKQKLNEAVDILEQLIKEGPEACHDYLTDIYKIRKFYTNFRYSFQDCKLYSSTSDINKKKLEKLLKEFVEWKNICYEQTDEECLRKFEMFDKRFGNIFTDFRKEVFSEKSRMYGCLKQLKNLICGIIMEVGNLWSNKCINNENLDNRALDTKCLF